MTWKEAIVLSGIHIAQRSTLKEGEPWRVHLRHLGPNKAAVRVFYDGGASRRKIGITQEDLDAASKYQDWSPVKPQSPLKSLIDLLD